LVPMFIKHGKLEHAPPAWSKTFEALFGRALAAYARALESALRHRNGVLLVAAATFGLMAWLYVTAPRGFFPQEDVGLISAEVETPQDMSYEGRLEMANRLQQVILDNPSIKDVASKVDHDTTAFTITLKDKSQRPPMADVIARLRKDTSFLPSIQVFFSSVQNLKVGGRSAKSAFQYTLQSVSPDDLDTWANKLLAELRDSGVFIGLNTDSQKNGLQATLTIDRDKAALMQVDMASVRSTLYSAYGGRQVSTIYAPEDSYQVIMELDPASRRDESDLAKLHVRSAAGMLVPLGTFASNTRTRGPMNINHQGQLPAVTISFDLAKGRSMSDAGAAIDAAQQKIGLPSSIFGAFAGQAALFQQSQNSQLWLILIAVAVIYVVLGMLYESWIHPITILLGIPSAAVGALLALRITGLELTFIAMIGILLLIGVVKKNAIMMIDFALAAQREEGMSAEQAIRQACLQRFRPIMMTTFCAIMGALPIALGAGDGAELRQPLGVSIVGGLLFSQLITLFITPVLFLCFDRTAAPRPRSAALDADDRHDQEIKVTS
jgi:HAE1 family hydrophobic/amphiphilic exporter-1